MAKRNSVIGLTWDNLTTNGRILTRIEMQARLGLYLTDEKYSLLKTAYRIAARRYHKDVEDSYTMRQFIVGFKKGSRNFRKVIACTENSLNMAECRAVQAYLRTVNVATVSSRRASNIMSNWNKTFLPSTVRVFIFKFYNNMLGLNSRVAHFNPGINASCTFCEDRKFLPAPKETMEHLFFYCPVVADLIQGFCTKFLRNPELEHDMYFTSEINVFEVKNNSLNLVLDIFRYVLWQYKLKKKYPTSLEFWSEFEYQLSVATGSSQRFVSELMDCNFFQIVGGDGGRP
jgi:hypothetical protein